MTHTTNEIFVKGDHVIEKSPEGKVVATKDYQHVISGYRATLHSPKTSQDAKDHAEQMIKELEASHKKSVGGTADKEHHDTHYRRVVGGLKASLKNEHVSEEKKKEIRARLDEMGEEHI